MEPILSTCWGPCHVRYPSMGRLQWARTQGPGRLYGVDRYENFQDAACPASLWSFVACPVALLRALLEIWQLFSASPPTGAFCQDKTPVMGQV